MQSERLVFVHRNNWVCSADPSTLQAKEYIRHFFFPTDWMGTNGHPIIKMTPRGAFIVAKGDEIAVIDRGLLSKESVQIESAASARTLNLHEAINRLV